MPAQTTRQLDLEILRKNRRADEFQVTGDPVDAGWLQERLRDWLTAHKWHPTRWPEFELVARPAGQNKTLAKIRT
jgi:hypothetical protein